MNFSTDPSSMLLTRNIIEKRGVLWYNTIKEVVSEMTYGVKVIHTKTVGENDQRYYEELILRVDADSFDDAYEKAACYMKDAACEYKNPKGDTVKTLRIEAVDCFLAYEPEGDVQEMYSSFSRNHSSLTEEEFYNAISTSCVEEELRPLRNAEFN